MTTETSSHTINLDWSLGDRIRKIRRELGMSQEEFAATINVNKKSLAAWELDVNEPRSILAVARQIEIRYGVPAVWTLGIETKIPGPIGPGGGERARQDSNLQPTVEQLDAEVLHFPQERAA